MDGKFVKILFVQVTCLKNQEPDNRELCIE